MVIDQEKHHQIHKFQENWKHEAPTGVEVFLPRTLELAWLIIIGFPMVPKVVEMHNLYEPALGPWARLLITNNFSGPELV